MLGTRTVDEPYDPNYLSQYDICILSINIHVVIAEVKVVELNVKFVLEM